MIKNNFNGIFIFMIDAIFKQRLAFLVYIVLKVNLGSTIAMRVLSQNFILVSD
ncbi:hypothetical protein D3C78_1825670 [compost metagenome]